MAFEFGAIDDVLIADMAGQAFGTGFSLFNRSMESPARIILESQNIGAPARNAHRPEPMASCRKTSVSAMDMSAVVWIRRRATRHSGAGIRLWRSHSDSMTRKLSRSISIPLKFQRMFMPPPATRVSLFRMPLVQ